MGHPNRAHAVPTIDLVDKQAELAAHRAAVLVYEQRAELQQQLGHPERAATARAAAEHARELLQTAAAAELAAYQAQIQAKVDPAMDRGWGGPWRFRLAGDGEQRVDSASERPD
jgi:hypothetical protein